MNISISEKKRVRLQNRECFGVTKLVSDSKAIIHIAKCTNESPGQYAITLLHELLHVWVDMIKKKGFPIDLRKEHPYIYAVEKAVMILTKQMIKKA
jgi:Zn-dependent peptidase ImmA (M78 family)